MEGGMAGWLVTIAGGKARELPVAPVVVTYAVNITDQFGALAAVAKLDQVDPRAGARFTAASDEELLRYGVAEGQVKRITSPL